MSIQKLQQISENSRVAKVFMNLDHQVNNGGFHQWILNEYMVEDSKELLEYTSKAIELGMNEFEPIHEIIKEIYSEYTKGQYEDYGVQEVDCMECDGYGDIQETCPDCYGAGCDECGDEGEIITACCECNGGLVEEELLENAYFIHDIDITYYNIAENESFFNNICKLVEYYNHQQ